MIDVCDFDIAVVLPHPKDIFWLRLPAPFAFSATKNKFYTIGCDIVAVFQGDQYGAAGLNSTSNHGICASFCEDKLCGDRSCVTDLGKLVSSCSGLRCSQASIPSGVQNFTAYISSLGNGATGNSKVTLTDNGRFAFLVEHNNFTYRLKTLSQLSQLNTVVDWKVGNETCEVAQKWNESFACNGNTECMNQPNVEETGFGGGYICKCLPGYQGNPYHPDGCQDIDECKSLNCCIAGETCINLPGTNSCTILRDDHPKKFLWSLVSFAMVSTIVLLVGVAVSIHWAMRKQDYTRLKQKYFEKNGGLLLQQQLACHPGSQTATIFTAEELEKATNKYHESRVLGEGGYGTFYKGMLPDNRTVAIKKSKTGAEISHNRQFINEVNVLSKINHKNVVRLLGCCLETPVPLLVYEFITNVTLFEHIHCDKKNRPPLPWKLRLKIATGALAYLHSSTSIPVLHRGVKTMNVLLDDIYTAKVADFGSSRLIRPLDETQVTTLVQGTLWYLDPEYLQSNQMTEKSDVYSIGVVLMELLTSQNAFSFARPEAERTLAGLLVSSLKKCRLYQILDQDIVSEIEKCGESAAVVANLAEKCFRLKGEERPTMKEIAMELEGLSTMTEQSLQLRSSSASNA